MSAFVSSVAVILLQGTLLVASGWAAHALLRNRHPRWRLILWRSILCFGVALPLVGLLRVPRVSVAALPAFAAPRERVDAVAFDAASGGPASSGFAFRASSESRETNAAAFSPVASTSAAAMPVDRPGDAPSFWLWLLGIVWVAGCAWEVFRLARLQRRLSRLVRCASPASAPVQSLAWQIQRELRISRPVQVRIADAIASPFLCGVVRPVILLPRGLADDLPPAELSALLTHELAHECRRDVAWCIGWRLMRAFCWFHPLVWRIPDAHVLACEEEADRVAAQRGYEGDGYARLLARLALRVLRVPSLAGFALAAALILLTAGWQFVQSPAPAARASIATATVLVTVHDENGRPIEGASIVPRGLRARGARLRSTGYGWVAEWHGPAEETVTDRDGRARVTYPVAIVPAEKIQTGEISFSVKHPNFASAWVRDYPVERASPPVQLKRGIPLRVAGYYGPNRQPVVGLVPRLIGHPLGVAPDDWQREPDGALVWRGLTGGKYFLQLAGRLPSGEIVYSDGLVFFGEQRAAHDLLLELKPGVRVEGRLDGKVPRPIKNGWIELSVHDDEVATESDRPFLPRRFSNTGIWFSYRPLDTEGRFVFESVPPGELKVVAHGDGFISANGPAEEQPLSRGVRRVPQSARAPTRSVPQSFRAVRPLAPLEIATEATATLKVRATHDGKPVAGARIHIWPNVVHMPSGSRGFAHPYPSSEISLRKMDPLPTPAYSAVTGHDGVALLRNIPAFTHQFAVEHDSLEVPVQPAPPPSGAPVGIGGAPNRYVEFVVTPGQTASVDVELQRKGREFIGEHR